MIAGTQSGIGKTTVTLAILKALKDLGYKVQSCKVGPDFIDPSHLERVTEAPCYNLDTFMMGETGVKRELAKCNADYVIIEGAMGLYDGVSSCAQIAGILKVPIMLVIDASASSESVAATALGFIKYQAFTPFAMTIAGVIVNNVGSERHAQSIRRSLKAINVPVTGMIQKDVRGIPSRHLGLYMGAETSLTSETLKSISDSLDVTTIQTLAGEIAVRAPPKPSVSCKIDVGIAYDAAFCFYYRSNIEAIEKSSNVTFFSPVRDPLPEVDALYFGGGYPELYATGLSTNRSLLSDVKTKALEGMPMYGECGGLMYLSRSLTTVDGKRYAFADILPADIQMTARRQALGHAAAEAMRECAIAHQGDALRGHEYHYSTASADTDALFAYRMTEGKGIDGYDGITEGNVVASYLHTHVYSMPREFDLFIERAAAYSRS